MIWSSSHPKVSEIEIPDSVPFPSTKTPSTTANRFFFRSSGGTSVESGHMSSALRTVSPSTSMSHASPIPSSSKSSCSGLYVLMQLSTSLSTPSPSESGSETTTRRYGAIVGDFQANADGLDVLLVVGGHTSPATDPGDPSFHTDWNGVAIDDQTGVVMGLPSSPMCDLVSQAGVWTGSELIVWSPGNHDEFCPAAAAYSPDSNSWRRIDADFFREAEAPVVWTGEEILSANGFSYRPDTNETGTSTIVQESPMFTGTRASSPPLMHWTGSEILALGSEGVIDVVPGQPLVDGPTPPISETARTSVWTPSGLLAVNYQMEAAMFHPESDTWEQMPDVPLPIWECVPKAFTGLGLAFVESCSGIAVWDESGDWKLLSLPAFSFPTYGDLAGQLAVGGGYLYVLGGRVFRYRLPELVDGVLPLPQLLPIGAGYLDVPDGWQAVRTYDGPTDPGTGTRQTIGVEVSAPGGGTCRVEWTNPGINPYVPAFTEPASLTRDRDGIEIPVGETATGEDGLAHVVIRDGALLDVICPDLGGARLLAAHLWSPQRPPYRLPPGGDDDPTCYMEPQVGMTDTRIVVQLRLLNPVPCALEGPLTLHLSSPGPASIEPDVTGNPVQVELGQTLTPDEPYLIATFTWHNWCFDPLTAGVAIGSKFQAFVRSVKTPCVHATNPSTLELTSLEGPSGSPALP